MCCRKDNIRNALNGATLLINLSVTEQYRGLYHFNVHTITLLEPYRMDTA